MNIIFVAAPAAGKGTQAKLVCDKYHLKHLSTGDLLREVTKKDDDFSQMIKERMSKGLLISDDIIIKLVANKIQEDSGYVFDGFPRNLNQAKMFDEMLDKIHQKIDYIIYLEIDEEIAKKRIVGRMVCPSCNNVYNYDLDQISLEHTCDCGSILVKREDDTLETFAKRFEVYEEETKPIIDYYKNRDNFYVVNSNMVAEEVFKQIESIIGAK